MNNTITCVDKMSFELYWNEFQKMNPQFKGSRMSVSDIWEDIDASKIRFDFDKSGFPIPSPFSFTLYPGDTIKIPTGIYFYRVGYYNSSGYTDVTHQWRQQGDTELLFPYPISENPDIKIDNKFFYFGEPIVLRLTNDNTHLHKNIIDINELDQSMIVTPSDNNTNQPVTIKKNQIICYMVIMDSHKFNR